MQGQTPLDSTLLIKKRFIERRPHSLNKFFASGEFTKFVKKTVRTVDPIFSNGIDWKAFLSLFQKLQVECNSDELSINSFENKGDGTFVIRVNVPSSADKPEIEKYLKHQYQLGAAKNKPIAAHKESNKEQSTDLLEMARVLANAQQPAINVEAKVVANNKSEQKQTLAEAAKEIQDLLKQLEQINPTATEPEQIAYINDETSPSFKRRAAKALKVCGEAAIEEFLDNLYVNVVKETIKDWLEA